MPVPRHSVVLDHMFSKGIDYAAFNTCTADNY